MERRKDLSLEFAVLKADATTGQIEGLANIGNIKDLQGDTLLPGAWDAVIKGGQLPPICWGHNPSDVRGKVIYLEELSPGDRRIPLNNQGGKGPGTASGLFFKAQMALETEAGRDAFALMKGGYIKGISVMYLNNPANEQSDGKGGTLVKSVDRLVEISAVIYAASPGSTVLMAKGLELAKAGTEVDPTTALRVIYDFLTTVFETKSEVVTPPAEETPTEQPNPEPTTEATAPDVSALTAEVLAFSSALGLLKGQELAEEVPLCRECNLRPRWSLTDSLCQRCSDFHRFGRRFEN